MCNVSTMLDIYDEQDSVSWLHIELLNCMYCYFQNCAISLEDTHRNLIIDFYFVCGNSKKDRKVKLKKKEHRH